MRPVTVNVGPVGTVAANNIALSQTPVGAGALTLNGSLAVTTLGVTTAVLPTPQRVLITTADTTHTFAITGTTSTGALLTETVTSSGTNVQSTLDYSTITSIRISGAATGAVTVGTSGVAATPWVRLDEWANTQVSIQCEVTGTANYTVQSSLDDPNSATDAVLPSAMVWIASNDATVVAATTSQQSNYQFAPTFVRVLLNSGSGSVRAVFAQANVANR